MTGAWRSRALYGAPFLGVFLLAITSPGHEGPTLCPFALATGTACPGCGMTRALGYLVHGQFGTALQFHPLVLLVAVQGVAGWAWLVLRRRDRVKPMSTRVVNAILVGTAVSLLVVWALRAATGTLPPV